MASNRPSTRGLASNETLAEHLAPDMVIRIGGKRWIIDRVEITVDCPIQLVICQQPDDKGTGGVTKKMEMAWGQIIRFE